MSDKDNVVIEMEKVNLWYNEAKETEVHAIKDISLSIKQGEYVAFFGPSGCGKTSMLYTISGIDRYQSGSIKLNNKSLTTLTNDDLAICRQTDIGIVFQQFNLIPSLTVLQNVVLPMSFLSREMNESKTEAMKLLERLSLTEYAHRYPFELSGGQQQRVGIARALANNPPIIIADEPLGNLDSVSAKNVLAFLKELNEKDGRTIIMVTHEAWSLQDVEKIFYMKDGEVTSVEEQNSETIAESLSQKLYRQLAGSSQEKEGESIPAKVLSHFLMRGYSQEEIERFEKLLQRRMANNLSKEDFYSEIDKPFKDGGVGFWKQKAERVSQYVEEIISKRHDVEDVLEMIEKNPELTITDEVNKIQDWLIQEYKGMFTIFQRMKLNECITKRLKGSFNTLQFRDALKTSKHDSGVGLSYRSSQIFSERLESLMVEGQHIKKENINTNTSSIEEVNNNVSNVVST
ncbi:ABC transporter ATP-binding protein [Candidatus Gracilibacteria bacterium]|nr:ABC transporter ATP-binding protein [Candidatus Gracilibacteria bacterium]MCF7898337.1 ABC transporter ATP-binding protein [Candidatus Paceibacterota bacterium]